MSFDSRLQFFVLLLLVVFGITLDDVLRQANSIPSGDVGTIDMDPSLAASVCGHEKVALAHFRCSGSAIALRR